MRRRDRDSKPRDFETEDMTPGSRAFLIFVGCVLVVCSACVLLDVADIAGYDVMWTAGWPPRIYQMTMVLLGIGVLVEVIRLLRRLPTPGAIASLLPIATLPVWMGLIATIHAYRGTYSIFEEWRGLVPQFSELAYAYDHCLSFVLIGLVASFPSVVAIGIGLYVRVSPRQ